jgi:K+-transporting ATPase ATPase A chain
MTTFGWLEIIVFVAVIGLLTRPLGGYLTRVYAGERIVLQPFFDLLEAAIYRCAGIDPKCEQTWYQYAISLLIFHALGIFALYVLLRAQPILPLNSEHLPAVAPDLALNTGISFVTNTSWQSYGGETTLSYTSQMLGITVQSFLSAASGMAVVIALIRGFARRRASASYSFVLRGYVRHWLGRIWAEYDRVGLTEILEAKESPRPPIDRPRPIIKIAES